MSAPKVITASNLKFVVIDLEFSPLPHGDWLLVAGAMINSLNKYNPTRLIGTPILLPKQGKPVLYQKELYETHQDFILNKKRPELMTQICKQIHESFSFSDTHNTSTLTRSRIMRYLYADGKTPCVVFWNGNTDLELLNRLNLKYVRKYLDMTTIHNRHDNSYDLILRDMSCNNHEIFKLPIGHYDKVNGGSLNLLECHNLICGQHHDVAVECHDPVTNVILSKCIFNYIVKLVKPSILFAYCNNQPVRLKRKNRKNKKSNKQKKKNNKQLHDGNN